MIQSLWFRLGVLFQIMLAGFTVYRGLGNETVPRTLNPKLHTPKPSTFSGSGFRV